MSEWWNNLMVGFPLLAKGGPVMLFLVFCSALVVAIFLERIWALLIRADKIVGNNFYNEFQELIRKNQLEKADFLCEHNKTSLARVLKAGLKHINDSFELIKEALEEAGKREVNRLSRYLALLATLANVSLLLGLLGTVTGMIRLFGVISAQGPGNPGALAGGIAEALLTTAGGLVIAIPTRLIHHYFSARVNQLAGVLEERSSEFLSESKKYQLRQSRGDKE